MAVNIAGKELGLFLKSNRTLLHFFIKPQKSIIQIIDRQSPQNKKLITGRYINSLAI
ncbi:hypothetical protein NIES2100_54410 [Calothrix sp. NIES-2100]|uniref:hypothetical protein n=1 Tax=Calothrix sp. NIES-2100 TaxID=1954172 RepID=UPI000B6139B7|nr:hypothetical protein NIES2100_54410 [Calothrix sp. NIES-2100]